MTFVHPIWLLLPLAVLPALWLAWWTHDRRVRGLAARFPAGLNAPSLGRPWTRLLTRFVFLAFLGLALARPQWGSETTEEVRSGRDVLLVLDTSRSMLATDAAPNRLEAAKLACLDLLRAIPNERVGVVAFAGSAYPVAPLANDHDAIRDTIVGLDTTILPVAGTNLATAIEAAAEAFKGDKQRSRAVIIFSDGEDLEGEWKDVVELAKKNRMVILAFGIGTEIGSLLPDSKSEGGFIRDPAGRPVLSKRDLTSLRSLAQATGGTALPLDPGTPVAALVKEALDRLERGESEKKTDTAAAEQFQWPLGAALAVLPFCLLAGRRVARTRRRANGAAAALFLLALLPAPARAAAGTLEQAAQAHKEGRLGDAIRLGGESLLDPDPRRAAAASANFASALYEDARAKLPKEKATAEDMHKTERDWEDALDHYDHSLRLRPDDRVSRNRQTVAQALEDLRKQLQQQEKQEQQQKDQEKQQQQNQQGQGDSKDQQKNQQNQQNQQGQGTEQKQDQNSSGNQQDKQDQQNGRDKPENQDNQGQGRKQSDPKDGDQKQQDPQNGQGQDQKDPQQKNGQGQNQKDQGQPQDVSSHGQSTREMQPGQEADLSGARMVVGPDGKLKIPEDPQERNRLMEMIRRNLQQHSQENRSVRLIPPEPNEKNASRKTW